MKSLFNLFINDLGVLVRGTDFIACRPKDHAIKPILGKNFQDIKTMFLKNK